MTGSVAAPPLTVADAVRQLAFAQKGAARGAPAYSLFVNRPLGRIPAAVAFRLGWTPNMVTALSAGFTLAGVLLLAVGYVLDSADGQLARLQHAGSAAGEWLDHVVDAWKISSVHLAVLVLAYRFFDLPSPAWLLVPLLFTIVAAVAFFAMILNDLLKAKHTGPVVTTVKSSTPLRSLLGLPTDYGVLCASFALLGAPPVFFTVYTALLAANALYLGLALVKWFGDMRALAPAPAEGMPRHRATEENPDVIA